MLQSAARLSTKNVSIFQNPQVKTFEPIVDVDHRPYCGPLAIARLTGVPVSRIEKMLRRNRYGRYRDASALPIKGTINAEVINVLQGLGCKVEKLSVAPSAASARSTSTQRFWSASRTTSWWSIRA